jgi:phosphoenolpyruvate-protein phosphotransferase/dihydroxyacetone kinase phosphotransfer subunit
VVGIVIVSHSATLAEGVAELAREMGGSDVAIEVAGGLDEPDRPLGTDATLVLSAIERADSGDGVLVLMDLGSAVLSAEMAVDMAEPERRAAVRLCAAPVVEGAVSAAAAARQGASLDEVAREAGRGLLPKASHLGAEEAEPEQADDLEEEGEELRLRVDNPLGLHARPAARFVQTSSRFDARISVSNASTGRGPANARSLSAVATLGVRRGHEIVVRASGLEAAAALAALRALADDGFGDRAAPARRPEPAPVPAAPAGPDARLAGVAASPGIALGPSRRFRPPEPEMPDRASGDPGTEWARLTSALEAARAELAEARRSVAARVGEEEAGILDAQALLLRDEAVIEAARADVFERGRSAEQAFGDAAQAVAAAYEGLDDNYQRGRAADVRDVRRRVLVALGGGAPGASWLREATDAVLVAEDLAPADVAALDPARVRAVAIARGGPTSHAAILARAAGIPAAVGLGPALLEVPDGTPLLVDGGAGEVLVAPPGDVVSSYRERKEAHEARLRAAQAAARDPARMRDGTVIEVMANAGSLEDAEQALAAGADGIGLLRTEFLFLGRPSAPSEEEQHEAYAGVVRALRGRPVVLRTLDVGGDKPLPFLPRPAEANPFLGVRGLRLALAEPELLRTQLRAATRAGREGPVKIMFPMVTTTEELREARRLLEDAARQADARPELGVMVEVPAVALAADRFAREVDFFSIGTNDLAQYTMAAERGNESLAELGDALHPAVLRLVRLVCEGASAHGRWVGVCGELAADPVAAPVLVGLGVSELSMSAAAIGSVKQAVRSLDMPAARAVAEAALLAGTAAEVRALASEQLEESGAGEGSPA